MNEKLIWNWNNVVQPEDTVYYLGDFSLAYRPVEVVTPRLNGTKYLVPGNHDFCHTYNKKSRKPENHQKWIEKYQENGWVVLPEQNTITFDEIGQVKLSHIPYDSYLDNYDDKFEKWRPENDGTWLLCGHVHEKWKTFGKMINVGVDVWDLKPVSILQIKELMNG